jgi:hypothetical protein
LQNNDLVKLKEVVDQQLRKELDILEVILQMEKTDLQAFHKWYINHPYYKGIREVKEIVGQRARNEEIENHGDGLQRSDSKEECN